MDATLDQFPASAAPRPSAAGPGRALPPASRSRGSWPGSPSRRAPWLLVLGLHGLLALLLVQAWTPAPQLPATLLTPVRWIAPAPPRPPEPARETARVETPARPAPQPATPAPLPTLTAPDAAAPVTAVPVALEQPAVEPVAPTTTPTPPSPTRVTIHAPRYLVEPRLNLPLASRRLGEQGLVQLRLHIGTNGELIEARLTRSSGFERLDAQALRDIRSARFAPLVENGRAMEWEALALLSYELAR